MVGWIHRVFISVEILVESAVAVAGDAEKADYPNFVIPCILISIMAGRIPTFASGRAVQEQYFLRTILHSRRRFMRIPSFAPLPLGSVDSRSFIAGCRKDRAQGAGSVDDSARKRAREISTRVWGHALLSTLQPACTSILYEVP